MDLSEIRAKIDVIDNELTRLFMERMDLAAEVAAYKKANNKPVLDASRERSKIAALAEQVPDEFKSTIGLLYQQIFALSRAYQTRLLMEDTDLTTRLKKALAEPPKAFPANATVACQGVEGAYSQHAAERLFRQPNILYFSSFEGVFKAIEAGMCNYGVLPVENSTAGSVNQVYDLMQQYHFSIVRTLRLKVDHCLLVRPGTKLSDIREVLSHPQAIAQSQNFLRSLKDVTVTSCSNTAEAARQVSESGRNDLASLGSRDCAALYGLVPLMEAVQDNGANYTRFICISRDLEIFPGADRTSVMLTIPHRPGSLYNALALIYALGVNLTKLESRPIADRDFEFMFYFDLESSVYTPEFLQLICELEGFSDQFHYLGSYNEVM